MSAHIFAVDAGSAVSSFVLFDTARQAIVHKGLDVPNEELLCKIAVYDFDVFAFERIASFGFPVGKEVLDTAEWNGRFRHAAEIRKGVTVFPITRKQVVVAFTGKATGGDAAVRAAMRERFGVDVVKTCTYDQTSALAIAAFASDHMNLSGDSADTRSTGGKGSENNSKPPAQSLLPVPVLAEPQIASASVTTHGETIRGRARESTIASKEARVRASDDSRGGQIHLSGARKRGDSNAGRSLFIGSGAGGSQPAQFISPEVSATSRCKCDNPVAAGCVYCPECIP